MNRKKMPLISKHQLPSIKHLLCIEDWNSIFPIVPGQVPRFASVVQGPIFVTGCVFLILVFSNKEFS